MALTLSESPPGIAAGGRYVAGVRKPSGYPAGYLDAASSEPLHPAARETLLAALERGYADARRLHGPGRDARLLLDNARAAVAECLGVRPDEVTFTSSGTEAVHRGLLGLQRARGGPVSVSAVEHSAVLHAARWLGEATPFRQVTRVGRLPFTLGVYRRAGGAGCPPR